MFIVVLGALLRKITNKILIILILIQLVAVPCQSKTSKEHVVMAVLGEARSSSCTDQEREAIARTIMNRGDLRGVYGYKAKMEPISARTREKAISAQMRAYGRDITNGATHFLSDWDLKHSRPSLIAWKDKMVVVMRTENFTFYKEKKR